MTHYEILEVSESASVEVIDMAYKALAKKYHPDVYSGDKCYAEQQMKKINEAHDVLTDPVRRTEYDRSLGNETGEENAYKQSQSDQYSTSGEDSSGTENSDNPDYEAGKELTTKVLHFLFYKWRAVIIGLVLAVLFESKFLFFASVGIMIAHFFLSMGNAQLKTRGFKKIAVMWLCGSLLLFSYAIVFGGEEALETNDAGGITPENHVSDVIDDADKTIPKEELPPDEQTTPTQPEPTGATAAEPPKETTTAAISTTEASSTTATTTTTAFSLDNLDFTNLADNKMLANFKFNQYAYAKENNIHLESFFARSNLLSLWMNDPKGEGFGEDTVYLEFEKTVFSGKKLKRTKYFSDLTYRGEIRDNRPHGYGMLYDCGELLYIGQFSNGQFSGYGLLFDGLFISAGASDEETLAESLNLYNHYMESFPGEPFFGVDALPNLVYEGEFKKGEACGKGNRFIPVVDFDFNIDSQEEDYNYDYSLYAQINIIVGDFEDGLATGKCKVYRSGMLYYSGGMKKGTKHGEGTLYYEGTDQISYKGGFRADKYHGRGTKYNKDGTIEYSGKWSNGDYA